MKKFITSIAASTLLFTSVLPTAFAAEESNDTLVSLESQSDYYYSFQGINFTGNVELDEAQLQDLYSSVQENSNTDLIKPFAHDIGSNSTTVVAPVYKTFSNKVEKFLIDSFVAYIVTKIPTKYASNFMFNFYFNKITGWASGKVVPTYVGSWVTRSWSEYDQTYIYYLTAVHYTDSTFKTVKDVGYLEVLRDPDPNRATW